MKKLDITFDQADIDAIASDFDLRLPNKKALRKLVMALTEDDFDPSVMQVLNLATGVGKTYLMAAFIEYLRRQDIENVMIVTPSLTVQTKTVQNFRAGSPRYIPGAVVSPAVTTPQDYSAWRTRLSGPASLSFGSEKPVMAFIFNIHQLIAPKSLDANSKGGKASNNAVRTRKFDESAGALFEYLQSRDDLVVIADESHLYGQSAKAFSAALRELDPAATIGLTASASSDDHVIYTYPLYQAIADQYVKAPVLAFRKSGYGTDQASEEQQIRDALALRSIKQAAYDSWIHSHPGTSHLNAVAFVVCSDVAHATQVADLLRSPGYLGNESAVLQVDNEHNDAATLTLLERLDKPDSPVLAVVSVNKLKEGWDVKNIAVVVTLRAMASEVLTQQTMGRGLRLPFGKWTGVRHIDQLDIISHQSFKDLLAAENVLTQFGLETAVDGKQSPGDVRQALVRAGENLSTGTDQIDRPEPVAPPAPATEEPSDSPSQPYEPSPGVSIVIIDDDTDLAETDHAPLEPVRVPTNPDFAGQTFTFPVTVMRAERPVFTLDKIKPEHIKAAAARVTSTGEVMVRKEIVAKVRRRLSVADAEHVEVESMSQTPEDASRTLLQVLMGMQVIPTTPSNTNLAKSYVVPTFMQAAPSQEWTVKSIASAVAELESLVNGAVAALLKETKVVTEIRPKQLPMETEFFLLPLGTKPRPQVDDRSAFKRGEWYEGWFKSLFQVESFDSWTGEYQLARLLNLSPNIKWWKRLHVQEGASIQYNLKQRYFPDFVALDTSGVFWIIEGKDARGRDNAEVQAKRDAAETTVIKLLGEPAFEGQRWGYLIAYEDDVAKADTWGDLKGRAAPVVAP